MIFTSYHHSNYPKVSFFVQFFFILYASIKYDLARQLTKYRTQISSFKYPNFTILIILTILTFFAIFMCKVKKFLKSLTRSTYVKSWDPSRGEYGFYTKSTNEHFSELKPLLIGSEEWDLDFIPNWTVDTV